MLRVKGKSLHEEGPVISVEVEGPAGTPRRVFIRNPYYRGPDPMKEVLWFYNNPDGTRGFVRNSEKIRQFNYEKIYSELSSR